MVLKQKSKAPAFTLRDQYGKIQKLSRYKGKKIVLYFYPKDNTPGCTVEAQEFNKILKKVEKKGAIILGVSPDNEVSHKLFSEKLELNFHLLADPDALIASKYGVYGEKNMYGRKFKSVFRTTFIIDDAGIIVKVFENVKVKGHAKEVFNSL
ncbi:MAG: thioredoxin-dependent thiol peroxidase [Nitrospinota bacterium]|nr:thioredoxin-dependent thiol peroxidase [Nitrospinota bacterium]